MMERMITLEVVESHTILVKVIQIIKRKRILIKRFIAETAERNQLLFLIKDKCKNFHRPSHQQLAHLLHKNDILFWDENGNKKYDADYPDVLVQSRSFGATVTLSIGYRF